MAGPERTDKTELFWKAFVEAVHPDAEGYDVVSFGNSEEMANELAELVASGQKRATAGLLRDFGLEGEPAPVVGGYVVLIDGGGQPRAIWRTTEARVGALNSVDPEFAWDEGEGDRTLEWWLAAHRDYFGRQARAEGFAMHDDIELVFERFEVVWPRALADQRQAPFRPACRYPQSTRW